MQVFLSLSPGTCEWEDGCKIWDLVLWTETCSVYRRADSTPEHPARSCNNRLCAGEHWGWRGVTSEMSLAAGDTGNWKGSLEYDVFSSGNSDPCFVRQCHLCTLLCTPWIHCPSLSDTIMIHLLSFPSSQQCCHTGCWWPYCASIYHFHGHAVLGGD